MDGDEDAEYDDDCGEEEEDEQTEFGEDANDDEEEDDDIEGDTTDLITV